MVKDRGFRFDRRGFAAALLAAVALAGCGKGADSSSGDAVAPAAVAGAVEKPNLKFGFIKLT
ncbi:MAG: nitrate ABC transporter substrate-binding protein, partial [Novosphingobium sp.]|nr:nitrate ABC transporter substrate-binding protein [Novosphingobium sp.]